MQVSAATYGRRRRMSLTSLIDVIFLLLLFFMLTSTFSRFGDVELTTGGGTGASDATRLIFVQLRGELPTLNGEAIAWPEIGPALATLRAEGRADAVIVSVGEDASAQQLVDMIGTVNTLADMPLQIVR